MNDIEIIISALEDLKEKINFDHNKERFENNTYKSAINYALATIKERQADKDRIKELEETLKCTQNSWFEDTKKIEEYKMLEANITKANEIIKDGIPKSLVKEKIEELSGKYLKFGNCKIEMLENDLIDRDIKLLQELLGESYD